MAVFAIAFYSHTTKKTSATEPRKETVVGTWSIFKKEKSRRIWKPCERTSCVRQRAVFTAAIHTGLNLTCVATSSHARLFLLLALKSLQDLCQFFL